MCSHCGVEGTELSTNKQTTLAGSLYTDLERGVSVCERERGVTAEFFDNQQMTEITPCRVTPPLDTHGPACDAESVTGRRPRPTVMEYRAL